MILAKEDIFTNLRTGAIKISPFEESLVSVNSVDVRLGADLWYRNNTWRDLYSPREEEWTKIEPVSVEEMRRKIGVSDWAAGIPGDQPCFSLLPGKFYLGTTLESIGTVNDGVKRPIVPEMKAKSTVGRQGLTVALCAGLGDIGYQSRWALEIRVTDNGPVPIVIGTTIAQVVFHYATMTREIYNGPSRYQNDGDVRFLPKPLKIIL